MLYGQFDQKNTIAEAKTARQLSLTSGDMNDQVRKVRLILFSKTPDCPTAKSRLRPQLGDEMTTKLHQRLLQSTAKALHFHEGKKATLHVFWHPEPDSACRAILPNTRIQHFRQEGSSFQERFENCLQSFPVHTGRVIVGSDCPFLDEQLVELAIHETAKGSLVIGPAIPDGFYLLGLPAGSHLRDMKSVFEPGADQINALKHTYSDHAVYLLPEKRDIDRPDDLQAVLLEDAFNTEHPLFSMLKDIELRLNESTPKEELL